MASKTLGRVACPVGCGHEAAQVKLKTDKEAGKQAYAYVHCAGCGVQLHTRSDEQARHLLRMTRAEKGAEDAPEPAKAQEAPQVPARVAAPAGGLFGGLFGVPA